MKDAFRAEWTKLRTLASTGWLLLATLTLTIGMSAAVTAATSYSSNNPSQDTTKLALAGVDLGQVIVAVLAVLAISEEYGTGMIRVTLIAMPRRLVLLSAKAANMAGLTLVVGFLAVTGCLLAGRFILPGAGFDVAPTLRAAVGSVLYFVLIGLLALGVATAIRDTAVSIGAVLALLYLPLLLAQVVSDPLRRHIQQIAPMTAGLAIQSTTNLRSLPISPWAGLGVLAAWATGALLVAGLLLRLRDA